jgi:hypothetical protein
LGWSAWVRRLQATYRVGDLWKFGPTNDIEISSGDRVVSDPDRSPLLIALYPRGDNSHKIDASGFDRFGKRERKNLSIFGRLIFIPGRLISHWRTSPMEKLRRVSFSGASGALGVLGSACSHSDMRAAKAAQCGFEIQVTDPADVTDLYAA